MDAKEPKKERFDLRLTKSNKEKLEKAARLAGHATLASFVTSTIIDRANEIIEKEEQILGGNTDREIFFNALMGNYEPNDALRKASEDYHASE